MVLLVALFAALRGAYALRDSPLPATVTTDRVVVVGVAGRTSLTPTDRAALESHRSDAQVGAVAVRPRYVGDCAAAGWTTLGAGRRAAVGERCTPEVRGARVVDWDARVAAAAARSGDARLGTLAESAAGCVAAVGPGAALAAARSDGSVAAYAAVADFDPAGALPCPITLIDPGDAADALIPVLAGRPGITLIVTGVGSPPGSTDLNLGVIYRLGAAVGGYLTSESTRRDGVVTLGDLTRTLLEVGRPPGTVLELPVDGAPFEVRPAAVSAAGLERHLAAVRALSHVAPVGYRAMAVGGFALFVVLLLGLALRRFRVPEVVLTYGTVLMASLMLAGAVPWPESPAPATALIGALAGWGVVLTAAAIGLGRLARIPAAVAGAALSVTAFTVDAALGGAMQPGSLLNSRPIDALRWYGFGNVTFAAYATSGLILAGYLAARFLARGRRGAALVAAAAIGLGIVVCEGWPTMGADFGGVIALTPAVLWLLLVLARIRITGPRLLVTGLGAVVAVAAISVLDWRRGPGVRSHLGNFVQRVVDGDAGAVVVRKAAASASTIFSLTGVAAVVLGVAAWVLIFRVAVPRLTRAFPTLRSVAGAVLITAVLGTLLNDGGIFVWITMTADLVVAVAWFWVHQLRQSALTTPPR